jgi:hypothetical protein
MSESDVAAACTELERLGQDETFFAYAAEILRPSVLEGREGTARPRPSY